MNDVYLFLEDVKPSLLTKYKKYNSEEIAPTAKKLLNLYPHIIFEHRNSILFFNSEETKEWFEVNGCVCFYSKKLGRWIQDYKQDVLGYTLGYPPQAVRYWNRIMGDRLAPRTLVNYYGMSFMCNPLDVESCINWLEENRPVPEHLRVTGTITSVTKSGSQKVLVLV